MSEVSKLLICRKPYGLVRDSDLLVAIDTEVADTQQTTLVNFD